MSRYVAPATSAFDDVVHFVGDPPLVRGECADEYEALFDQIAEAVAPTDAIEWIWTKELADCLWEARRARRMRDAIFELKRHASIKQVVATILQENGVDAAVGIKASAERLAAEWTNGGAEGEANMVAFLADYGLTPAAIMAETYMNKAPIFDQLERQVAAADKRRDALLREIEHRRAARAQRFRTAANTVDAESEDLPPPPAPRLM